MNGYRRNCTRTEVTCQALYNGYMPLDSAALPEPDQAEELFISFGNTLEYRRGEPVDAVPDITSLLAWLRERRLISGRGLAAEAARLRRDPEETARRIERFHHLRQVLHGIAAEVTENGHPTSEQLRGSGRRIRSDPSCARGRR